MFAESTLEISWGYRARRSWMTLMSFGLQAVVVGLLLMIPLLQTVGLPAVHTVSTPVNLGRPAPEPAPHPEGQPSRGVQIIPFGGRIMAPGRVPSGIPKGARSTHPRLEEVGIESAMVFFRSAPLIAFPCRLAGPGPLCLLLPFLVFEPSASRAFSKGA